MYTDREEFEGWMQRIMQRFDLTEKLLERVLKKNSLLDGEELLDNQDLWLSGRCLTSRSAGRYSTGRRMCRSSSVTVSMR